MAIFSGASFAKSRASAAAGPAVSQITAANPTPSARNIGIFPRFQAFDLGMRRAGVEGPASKSPDTDERADMSRTARAKDWNLRARSDI